MKDKKKILIAIFAVILLGAAGIVMYYWVESTYYVKTEDARIASPIITLTAPLAGRVTDFAVVEGDQKEKGDILANIDTGLVSSQAKVDINTLEQGGSMDVYKSTVTAPVKGTIIKIGAAQGQMVAAGQTLAVMAETGNTYVSANIEETEVYKLKKGQPVEITVDSMNSKKFMGRVQEIGYAAVSTFSILPTQSSSSNFTKVTQLIPVKIQFPEAARLGLVPGMSVEVKIHVKG